MASSAAERQTAAAPAPASVVRVNPLHHAIKVRRDASTGDGLYAIKDIVRGTRIVAEAPVVSTPPVARTEHDKVRAFCEALAELPRAKAKEIDGFYCDPARISLGYREAIRSWYIANTITDDQGVILKGNKLQDAVEETTRRWATFSTNVVEMGASDEEDGSASLGLFPYFSRINHSCLPNAYNNWNPDIQLLTVHVDRDIKAGEQIFGDYIGNPYLSRQERAEYLEHWGFACQCVACRDPTTDALRNRTSKLHQSVSPIPEALGSATRLGKPVKEALEETEELIGLLKKQGLGGPALCRMYREGSVYGMDAEKLDVAVDYARLELECERAIYGTETEYLRRGLQGAEYWLEQLEKIRAAPSESARKKQVEEFARLCNGEED